MANWSFQNSRNPINSFSSASKIIEGAWLTYLCSFFYEQISLSRGQELLATSGSLILISSKGNTLTLNRKYILLLEKGKMKAYIVANLLLSTIRYFHPKESVYFDLIWVEFPNFYSFHFIHISNSLSSYIRVCYYLECPLSTSLLQTLSTYESIVQFIYPIWNMFY